MARPKLSDVSGRASRNGSSTQVAVRTKYDTRYTPRAGTKTDRSVTQALRKASENLGKGQKALAALIKQHKQGEVVKMTVTPDMAADWLSVNMKNRKLRDARVIRLARVIATGQWVPYTGDTIKFAPNGRLLDGQHRLAAVLVADMPIDTYVAFGINEAAFPALDTNLVRSSRDALYGAGETNERVLAAVINAMGRYLNYGRFDYNTSGITNTEILAILDACPGLREAANGAMQLRKRLVGLSWGVAGVCLYLFREKNEADAEEFFHRLQTGANLRLDDPIYILRERLGRPTAATAASSFSSAQEQAVLMFKAWNFFRRDQYIDARSLQYRNNEQLPELV